MQKIGVVGAGNMGAGIAQKYATEGFQVVLLDKDEKSLAAGQQKMNPTPELLSRLTFSTDFELVQDATLVVEAIYENKELKKKLFQKLDSICKPETLLATNTSSFYVRDMAENTRHPERILGLHYFFPAAKNRLVEVIKGQKTSQKAFDTAFKLQEQIGKVPVESKDSPGFIVNRFFVPWLNEAMRILNDGVADIATIEAAAKETFLIGMGPFELMNVTGAPITFHAANTLANELGEFYRPCPLIKNLIEHGQTWDLTGNPDRTRFEAVSKRLLQVVFDITSQMVHKENVCTAEACDLAAKTGLRWKKGPFELSL